MGNFGVSYILAVDWLYSNDVLYCETIEEVNQWIDFLVVIEHREIEELRVLKVENEIGRNN